MEGRDLGRAGNLRLPPDQDEAVGVEHGGGQDRGQPERCIAVEFGLAHLATDDHQRAGETQQRSGDRLAANDLAQHQPREIERDQRRDETDGDGFGQRQLGDRIEEGQCHESRHDRALQMQRKHCSLRPAPAARQPQRQRDSRGDQRAQPGRTQRAHGQRRAFHVSVHQGQAGDGQRCHQHGQEGVIGAHCQFLSGGKRAVTDNSAS